MAEDPSAVDRELARLRAKAGEQDVEIARLRDEAAEATGELAQLGAETGELHRRESDLSVCTTAAHQLTPGTGVLLYTDGVTEARHNGDQFGQTRLAQIVQSFKGQVPSEVAAAVTSEVHQFAATHLADDLCVVAARIGEG